MKKILSVMMIIALIALPMAAMALEQVTVKVNKGNSTNYRSEPSLNGEKLGALKSEEEVLFADETSVDDRGVVWYKVYPANDYENTAWISSKYTVLTNGSVDGLSFNEEYVGTWLMLSDDTLAVDPFKGVGEVNLAKDADVGCSGFYIVPDGENTWICVGDGDGHEGWVNTLNAVKVEDEEEAAE